MSGEVEVLLPKLGESITEATVVQWFKNEGDLVDLDEPLLEVSTDKINSEIPSPISGVLSKIVAGPNQLIQVGARLALVSSSDAPQKPTTAKNETPIAESTDSEMKDFLSPAVLRLMREKNIPLSEIDQIPRTGEGKRLTKKDVEAYSSKPKKECPFQTERVKMTPLRKAIADNMVKSFYEAPHASIVSEVDVTEILKYLKQEKETFLKENGCKLTITSYVVRAMAQAVRAFPLINASLENDTILMKGYVNLGIAVSVDQGVMVPVIKHAERLDIVATSKAISELASKARKHELQPDDVQDGSITLTNFGMAGALIGTPIIRHPEVAILGMGAIHKKVAVLSDDSFGVRSVMNLSLTFDHRVLDGMYGCGYLAEVKKHLENPF